MELVIKISPNVNTYCITIITGNHKIFQLKPTPVNIINKNIIIHEIKKLTNPLVTIDMGNISLGKYTFLIMPLLTIIVLVPFLITVVNQFHGKIPIIRN